MLVERNGRHYSYKSVRRGGKVVSLYQGCGDFAVLHEQLDRRDRLRAAHKANLRRAEDDRIGKADAKAEAAIKAVLGVAKGILERSGCHRHNRGDWRRKRGQAMSNELATMTAKEARDLGKFREWADATANKALDGDSKAANRLKHAFHGDSAGFIEAIGQDTADLTTMTMASRVSKDQVPERALSHLFFEDAEKTRINLAGENPSPIVALLAEAAGIARLDWLTLMMPATTEPTEAFERRKARSHARYLKTLKLIAQVRKLERPTVAAIVNTSGPTMVNVGG